MKIITGFIIKLTHNSYFLRSGRAGLVARKQLCLRRPNFKDRSQCRGLSQGCFLGNGIRHKAENFHSGDFSLLNFLLILAKES
jgi:hypothetical protein